MLDPSRPIVLISDSVNNESAIRSLLRVGLDNILGSLKGGMSSWIEAGMNFARTHQLSAEEVADRNPEVIVLDVRSDKEWNSGHIAGSKHVMLGNLQNNLRNLPKESPIVTACGSGYRSSIAASLLQAGGFSNISSMDGGMTAWMGRQLPVGF